MKKTPLNPGARDGHRAHDRLLIARLAADDAEPTELEAARRLVEQCAGCAELLADLTSLARATAALPTLPAPRDFRLTPAQAESLRGGSWVDRALRAIGSPRLRPLEGLASTALSLGIVLAGVSLFLPAVSPGGGAMQVAGEAGPGEAVPSDDVGDLESPEPAEYQPDKATTVPGEPVGGEGAPGAEATVGGLSGNPAAATAAARSSAPGAEHVPFATGSTEAVDRSRDEDGDGTAVVAPPDGDDAGDASSRPDTLRPLLLLGGLLLAAVGLAVAALRTLARRRASDPLFR